MFLNFSKNLLNLKKKNLHFKFNSKRTWPKGYPAENMGPRSKAECEITRILVKTNLLALVLVSFLIKRPRRLFYDMF